MKIKWRTKLQKALNDLEQGVNKAKGEADFYCTLCDLQKTAMAAAAAAVLAQSISALPLGVADADAGKSAEEALKSKLSGDAAGIDVSQLMAESDEEISNAEMSELNEWLTEQATIAEVKAAEMKAAAKEYAAKEYAVMEDDRPETEPPSDEAIINRAALILVQMEKAQNEYRDFLSTYIDSDRALRVKEVNGLIEQASVAYPSVPTRRVALL
jgi:hypothetical protein